MKCNPSFSLALSLGLLAGTTWGSRGGEHVSDFSSLAPRNSVLLQDCSSGNDVLHAVRTLSLGTYDEQQKAVAFLRAEAGRSSACRKQVVTNLMSAMDQPGLDLTSGTPQFFIWHYGARLLGDLRAIEALDLLIANFDLHDGSGFPLNHHPALNSVIDMGEIALPKLQTVLKEHPDRNTRRYAVFCIALTGGRSAHQILSQALKDEADPCVASCIQASLTAFNNKRRPHYISDEKRTAWYTTFLCNAG
jgi:hypothetical protein